MRVLVEFALQRTLRLAVECARFESTRGAYVYGRHRDRSFHPLTSVWRAMPESDKRDALVGRIALVVAATAVIAVAATVLALALPSFSGRFRTTPVPSAYADGDSIDLEPETYNTTTRTVFFFTRSSCGACQASKPVMAGIVADVAKRAGIRVALVTPEALAEEEEKFARDLGLDPSQIYRTDLRRLRLRQVPTMVVTDHSGRILMVREGLLTESDREDVVHRSTEALTRP